MSGSGGRSTAEWTTFAGSCAVLLIVVALIGGQVLGPSTPAAPQAVVSGMVRDVDGQHYVDVQVSNTGDETAANVGVSAELEVDGETATGDQTIDFLAGGEKVDLVFVFDESPDRGVLRVRVTGYADP